ncbi:hypothetical protein D3C75_1279810 [compost metagenome]
MHYKVTKLMSKVKALTAWIHFCRIAHDEGALVIERKCINPIICIRNAYNEYTYLLSQLCHARNRPQSKPLISTKTFGHLLNYIHIG